MLTLYAILTICEGLQSLRRSDRVRKTPSEPIYSKAGEEEGYSLRGAGLEGAKRTSLTRPTLGQVQNCKRCVTSCLA
jgi:hypothetical protein